MTQFGRNTVPFADLDPDEVTRPDLNPYLLLHRQLGPPVLTAEEAKEHLGRWDAAFAKPAPLHVEIGSGNGFFLSGMAAKHPERNWLGIEIRFKRVVLCAKKIKALGVGDNARIARYDAWWLEHILEPGVVAGLYVNHPDPWAKDSEAKKRLMSPFFAAWAASAMQVGAMLRLKSDHLPNIDALQAAIEGLPFALRGRVEDIQRNGTPWPVEDDVITNYQSKFIKRGLPVHALWLERI